MDSPFLGVVTMMFGKVGVVVGTTTTTTTTTGVGYAIRGKAYLGVAASNGATPTTDAVTGAAFLPIGLNKAGVFVWCYDTAGALKIVQGEIVNYTDTAVFERAPAFPAIPYDTLCPIAYQLTKVISTGSAWTMGVSNQASQTGITKVIVDCAVLPDRPQLS